MDVKITGELSEGETGGSDKFGLLDQALPQVTQLLAEGS